MAGAVPPGAVSPGAVSPGAVSAGAVSPGAASPGAASPGAVSPGAVWHAGAVPRAERWAAGRLGGLTVWLTGLSGSGKSTVAGEVGRRLAAAGRAHYVLDGDNLRHGLNGDLGYDAASRQENVRRAGEVACLMADAGLVVLACLISPYRAGRDRVRAGHAGAGLAFVEVWVDTPLELCESRDPKGLYRRARAGRLAGMTGIDDPYEAPAGAEVVLRPGPSVADHAAAVLGAIGL